MAANDRHNHIQPGPSFPGQNAGSLISPKRNIGAAPPNAPSIQRNTGQAYNLTVVSQEYGLALTQPKPGDPPGYEAGSIPRGVIYAPTFYVIDLPEPAMPQIPVTCTAVGFDPRVDFPIEWKLECLHVFCRHTAVGGYRYRADGCDRVYGCWQGTSQAAQFTLFNNDPNVNFTLPTPMALQGTLTGDQVVGGHAILTVTATPPKGPKLVDYAHFRIAGRNAPPTSVVTFVDSILAPRDPNLALMMNAIAWHESGKGKYLQFQPNAQSGLSMRFMASRGMHPQGDPPCKVLFSHPADPPDFPYITFDRGVGLSQYTILGDRKLTAEVSWDWQGNLLAGMNHLLQALRKSHVPNKLSWKQWAWLGYRGYNGSGAQARAYANERQGESFGRQVSGAAVPPTLDVDRITAPVSVDRKKYGVVVPEITTGSTVA